MILLDSLGFFRRFESLLVDQSRQWLFPRALCDSSGMLPIFDGRCDADSKRLSATVDRTLTNNTSQLSKLIERAP